MVIVQVPNGLKTPGAAPSRYSLAAPTSPVAPCAGRGLRWVFSRRRLVGLTLDAVIEPGAADDDEPLDGVFLPMLLESVALAVERGMPPETAIETASKAFFEI